MKIINLSTSDIGGAGIAAYRFNNALKSAGYDSSLLVRQKSTSKEEIIMVGNTNIVSLKKKITKVLKATLPTSIYNKIRSKGNSHPKVLKEYCFYNFKETEILGLCPEIDDFIDTADVVFVHYVSSFLNTYDLLRIKEKTGCRIIFTMMDPAPVTGGCHYPWECTGYQKSCRNCPALQHTFKELAINQNRIKALNISMMEAEIIASTEKDYFLAKTSSIPFSKYWKQNLIIALDVFKPNINSLKTNKEYYLLNNAHTISDIRKGFDYFLQTLILLDKVIPEGVILKVLCLSKHHFKNFKFSNILFEEFEYCNSSAKLAKLYQKVNIFVCTSLEDSGPMMLVEALLCGLPVVTFDTGIANELIVDGYEGYIVPKYAVNDMVVKIREILLWPSNKVLEKEAQHKKFNSQFSHEAFINGINRVLANH